MKYEKPALFDGTKFAVRYKLNSLRMDFWADEKWVYLRDGITLPDNPPIFEAPDAPPPPLSTRLDALKTLPELIELLKKELRNG